MLDLFNKRNYHDFDVSKDERPVFTVSVDRLDDGRRSVSGGLVFVNSKETVIFDGVLPADLPKDGGFPFDVATLTRRRTGKVLAVCEKGTWAWVEHKKELTPALEMLKTYLEGVISSS